MAVNRRLVLICGDISGICSVKMRVAMRGIMLTELQEYPVYTVNVNLICFSFLHNRREEFYSNCGGFSFYLFFYDSDTKCSGP